MFYSSLLRRGEGWGEVSSQTKQPALSNLLKLILNIFKPQRVSKISRGNNLNSFLFTGFSDSGQFQLFGTSPGIFGVNVKIGNLFNHIKYVFHASGNSIVTTFSPSPVAVMNESAVAASASDLSGSGSGAPYFTSPTIGHPIAES